MFGWLKKAFSRKKKEEQPVKQETVELPPVKEAKEPAAPSQIAPKKNPGDPDRPEKICQKCGAPNDVFVDICWMCKEKV